MQRVPAQVGSSLTEIYRTRPLTYYIDLATLPNAPPSSGTFQDTLQALESFVYGVIGQNVPPIDRIALIQDPSAHLLVADPQGRMLGIDSHQIAHSFAGGGYTEAGGRSIAWILEPVLGDYHVSMTGPAGLTFSTDVADLQFLGHGSAPLIENFTWLGTLPANGAVSKRFFVRGTALSPVLTPHVSQTRVRPLTQVRFTLTGSVIPLGIASVVWRFGDGTSTTRHPAAHRYHKAGRYMPTVTVTDAVGDTVTVNLPVIVVKP